MTGVFLISVWRLFANKKAWYQIPKSHPFLIKQIQLLIFLFSLFFVYLFMIAGSPYLFLRHFIVLQPVFTLIMALEIIFIATSIKLIVEKNARVFQISFEILCFVPFFANAGKKINFLKEHIYQCTHQMKGVLDYDIPYILDNFKNPNSLTIATNYEKFSLMDYLKSKVAIGFIGNELEEAAKIEPDVLIYRKGVGGGNAQVFNNYLQKKKYNRVAFPVYDYPVNNIPEIEFMIPHLFKTKFASQDNEKVDLFIKDTLELIHL